MDLLDVFEGSDDLVALAPGAVLFEEGDPAELMYVIMEGEIGLSLHGKTIAHAVPGDVIGEMALVSTGARSATATAESDCQLIPIDVHSFKVLIQHTPEFALHIMSILADRLRDADEVLSEHPRD